MTPISLLSIMTDATTSGAFTVFAMFAWRFHEGPVRARLVTACVAVAADTGAAVAVRLLNEGVLPIWYIPIWGMILPLVVYALVLHLTTLRARIRVLHERVEPVAIETRRREQATLERSQQS